MKKEHTWGWPIAGYLFLGGLGGGMMVTSTVADLFFDMGGVFVVGDFVAATLIAIGSGFLIFELGRPLQFWRVFSRERAILTVGAWMLGLFVAAGIVYGSFWLSFLPWSRLEGLRSALAWICLSMGLGVVLYTGVFLGTLKARPFWNSPALPILFLVSGLSTGIAAQSLLLQFWPLGITEIELATIGKLLRASDISLLVLEAIVLMLYVLSMRVSATAYAARAATAWLSGDKRLLFWGGLVGFGLVLPLVLYALDHAVTLIMAALAILTGGVILRFLVVYTDDRPLLPGEEKFFARLPDDNEAFLSAWKD